MGGWWPSTSVTVINLGRRRLARNFNILRRSLDQLKYFLQYIFWTSFKEMVNSINIFYTHLFLYILKSMYV